MKKMRKKIMMNKINNKMIIIIHNMLTSKIPKKLNKRIKVITIAMIIKPSPNLDLVDKTLLINRV
jgi:hypothetical protein